MNTERTDIRADSRAEARKRLRTVIRRGPSCDGAARKPLKPGEKLRVAVYRRVSPYDLEQVSSTFLLAAEAERRINTQPTLLYAGIYIDSGKERMAFERLMDAARSGEVDRIEARSMFSFANSVGELLSTVCALRCLPHPVQVHFEAEDITSGTGEWEHCVCFLMSCLNAMYRTRDLGFRRTVEVG